MSQRLLSPESGTGTVGAVLAVDAGTTGVTVLLVTEAANVLARGYAEFAQHFPHPGWVEHAPEEIWQATLTATQVALDAAPNASVRAVGSTNQRETAVLWDRQTLAAPRRAIVWQDRRTSAICERLESAGHGARVTELTGLRLDPYFTGTKLTWLRENDPPVVGRRPVRPGGSRDRRLLPRRPDVRRRRPCHRRLQRLAHPPV